MDSQTFSEIIEDEIEHVKSLLISKGDEYAQDNPDRLHNFVQAAHLQKITLAEALNGFRTKHEVSIQDMIKSGDVTQFSDEKWREKITDNVVYLLILLTIVEEERRKNSEINSADDSDEKFYHGIRVGFTEGEGNAKRYFDTEGILISDRIRNSFKLGDNR